MSRLSILCILFPLSLLLAVTVVFTLLRVPLLVTPVERDFSSLLQETARVRCGAYEGSLGLREAARLTIDELDIVVDCHASWPEVAE